MSKKDALTVGQLREHISRRGFERHDIDVVMIRRADLSIGGSAATAITGVSFGFDWDRGKCLLSTADPLVLKSDKQALWDSARDFLYMLSGDYGERKGKRYLTSYAKEARRLLEKHGLAHEKIRGIDE